jgi:hypothetical protein
MLFMAAPIVGSISPPSLTPRVEGDLGSGGGLGMGGVEKRRVQ